eukprot:CAMPEP_0204494546 /NCGR_PEP_ID=MMETSP0471-20130131/84563_1 /ASSEMBLY_ACC=CAM_ASM_000602 /TAXON_ID=2969 /ORGANISM="Oxyrrhis marina" /LENGTH=37 /DNA_ID= /DNA_START= /DNA_END= /DNA_ORIENTATION=
MAKSPRTAEVGLSGSQSMEYLRLGSGLSLAGHTFTCP